MEEAPQSPESEAERRCRLQTHVNHLLTLISQHCEKVPTGARSAGQEVAARRQATGHGTSEWHLLHLSDTFLRAGHFAKARQLAARAVRAIAARCAGDGVARDGPRAIPGPHLISLLVMAFLNVALAQQHLARSREDAQPLFAAALDLSVDELGEGHPVTGQTRAELTAFVEGCASSPRSPRTPVQLPPIRTPAAPAGKASPTRTCPTRSSSNNPARPKAPPRAAARGRPAEAGPPGGAGLPHLTVLGHAASEGADAPAPPALGLLEASAAPEGPRPVGGDLLRGPTAAAMGGAGGPRPGASGTKPNRPSKPGGSRLGKKTEGEAPGAQESDSPSSGTPANSSQPSSKHPSPPPKPKSAARAPARSRQPFSLPVAHFGTPPSSTPAEPPAQRPTSLGPSPPPKKAWSQHWRSKPKGQSAAAAAAGAGATRPSGAAPTPRPPREPPARPSQLRPPPRPAKAAGPWKALPRVLRGAPKWLRGLQLLQDLMAEQQGTPQSGAQSLQQPCPPPAERATQSAAPKAPPATPPPPQRRPAPQCSTVAAPALTVLPRLLRRVPADQRGLQLLAALLPQPTPTSLSSPLSSPRQSLLPPARPKPPPREARHAAPDLEICVSPSTFVTDSSLDILPDLPTLCVLKEAFLQHRTTLASNTVPATPRPKPPPPSPIAAGRTAALPAAHTTPCGPPGPVASPAPLELRPPQQDLFPTLWRVLATVRPAYRGLAVLREATANLRQDASRVATPDRCAGPPYGALGRALQGTDPHMRGLVLLKEVLLATEPSAPFLLVVDEDGSERTPPDLPGFQLLRTVADRLAGLSTEGATGEDH